MANATQTTKDAGGSVIDHARDTVSHIADQAREGAATVTEKAKEAGTTVANKADEMAGRVGSGLETAADTIRDNAPNSGMLGSAASTVADTLERGGKYLEAEGLSGLAGDVTEMIKRNPIPALLVAVAVGVLIARATRS